MSRKINIYALTVKRVYTCERSLTRHQERSAKCYITRIKKKVDSVKTGVEQEWTSGDIDGQHKLNIFVKLSTDDRCDVCKRSIKHRTDARFSVADDKYFHIICHKLYTKIMQVLF